MSPMSSLAQQQVIAVKLGILSHTKTSDIIMQKLPPYHSDLTTIHVAILTIIIHGPDIQKLLSNEELFEEELDKISEREEIPVWQFTAALYCEALIKTLGLWDDTK